MKYGLLKTTSLNIGDEIQCLAASRFLPRIDTYVHREMTNTFRDSDSVKVIMNHYWLHKPNTFPPSACIDPLYISFHLKYSLRNTKFVRGKVYEHFKSYEPIGCRDKGTAEFLNSIGIDAYFSGCLTSTLLPNENLKNKYLNDYILCVDVPNDVVDIIKSRTSKKVICISRHQNICFGTRERLKLAKFTLFLYHNAFCVITIALHAAMPSTAFGTPVCVLDYDDDERKSRFDGLENVFNWVPIEEFKLNDKAYDINNPPKNPEIYRNMRDKLVERCVSFTEYDSKKSLFEDDYNPLIDLAEIMRQDGNSEKKVLWFVKQYDLIKTFVLRFFKIKDRHMI